MSQDNAEPTQQELGIVSHSIEVDGALYQLLFDLVRVATFMRAAQVEYFRTRDFKDLHEAKNLEKDLDQVLLKIKARANDQGKSVPKLLSTGGMMAAPESEGDE